MELYNQWLAIATQIQQRNEVLNQHCVAASFKFQDSDFRCCVLKGQGVAQLYNANDGLDRNMPRQSGDIDLWVSGEGKI